MTAVSSRDVRRLLRALGNPVALKRDALAARLVGQAKPDIAALQERADRIVAILRASLASMCSHAIAQRSNDRIRRAAGIIERCDLTGHPHDVVAREIGLARRQFYRDRSLALDALALELEDLLRAKPVQTHTSVDATQLSFDVAEVLVGLGKYDEVEALLHEIMRSSATADNRQRAGARLVEAAYESGERARMLRSIERAMSFRESSGPADSLPHARLDLALALAHEMVNGPGPVDQRTLLLDQLRASTDATEERWETLALGLSHHATAAHTRGDFTTSLACLHEAEAVLRRCERSPLTLTALLPNLLGVSLMMLPRSLDAASEQHKLAVSLGRARGLMRIVVASTLNDYAIDLWQGRAGLVCARAMETLETARAVTSREEFGRMVLLVAKIALGAGRREDALRLLGEVQGFNDDYPRLRPRAILAQVEFFLSAGDFKRACVAARAALEATRHSGETSLVGTALLLNAEALLGTKRRSLARKVVDKAILTLEQTGSAHALGRARALAKQLRATPGERLTKFGAQRNAFMQKTLPPAFSNSEVSTGSG